MKTEGARWYVIHEWRIRR